MIMSCIPHHRCHTQCGRQSFSKWNACHSAQSNIERAAFHIADSRAWCAMDFTLETQLIVKWGNQTWCPKQKVVDEQRFFQLNKWDRGFIRWVTGRSLDLRASSKEKETGSVNCSYGDEVVQRRQDACDDALEMALQPQDGEPDDEPPTKKKKVRRKARDADGHLCPEILPIKLPEVDGNELEVKVLFEGAQTSAVWIEMELTAMAHLKTGIVNSNKKERKSKALIEKKDS